MCLFCHYGAGWAGFNITIVAITTGWQQPLCPLLALGWGNVGARARNPQRSEQGYGIRAKFRGLLSRRCNNSINHSGRLLPLRFYKGGFSTFSRRVSGVTSRLRLCCGVASTCLSPASCWALAQPVPGFVFFFSAPLSLHMCVFPTWPATEPLADKWRSLAEEEGWAAGSLLILTLFWYFALDLRRTIRACGKYRADCKILAPLFQGITWAWPRASLKALNASTPTAVPLFPGAGLSVKALPDGRIRAAQREEKHATLESEAATDSLLQLIHFSYFLNSVVLDELFIKWHNKLWKLQRLRLSFSLTSHYHDFFWLKRENISI